METRPIFFVDAFTDVRFDGNRAGVVFDPEGLDDAAMLKIAGEVNASETAFAFGSVDADYRLRFFTPAMEVNFCGHAFVGTLAALALTGRIKVTGEYAALKIRTNVGLHEAEVGLGGGRADVTMRQAEPLFRPNPHPADAIIKALGLTVDSLSEDLQPGLGFTGLWHLFVPVLSKEDVLSARPNFDLLAALNREAGVVTTHLFARDGGGWYCRGFAPAAGVDEDPYTGSAAGALGAYLVKNGFAVPFGEIKLEQRNAAGRGGVAVVSVGGSTGAPSGVKVTGKAVLSLKGEVYVGD